VGGHGGLGHGDGTVAVSAGSGRERVGEGGGARRGDRHARAGAGRGGARVGDGQGHTILLAESLNGSDDLCGMRQRIDRSKSSMGCKLTLLLGRGALLLHARLDLGDERILGAVALEVGDLVATVGAERAEEAVERAAGQVAELGVGGRGQREGSNSERDLHYDGVEKWWSERLRVDSGINTGPRKGTEYEGFRYFKDREQQEERAWRCGGGSCYMGSPARRARATSVPQTKEK
jgi:hypothetical protein